MIHVNMETNGPASSLMNEQSDLGCDMDIALSFACIGWPPEATEFLSRPRLYGWPKEALIYDISQSGCHVVPVGDKTSADSFLQWRISFATSERKLIHSLSHEQFLVYGLLKYFLKQTSGMLKQITGGVDVLSSYIMKTVMFFAVESTSQSLWKEQNTFLCFRLCLKILIAWVNAGYCPNYFIIQNNMFKGKLYDGIQSRLLRFLLEMYDMEWVCLSVGTLIQPSIGVSFQRVMNGEWKDIFISPKALERECDLAIFRYISRSQLISFTQSLALLSKSQNEIDQCIAFLYTLQSLSSLGMLTFGEAGNAKGNKQRYKSLRKSKNLIKPFASACTSPGLLLLATFYYQTGNYMRALVECGTMLSSFKCFVEVGSVKDQDKYEHLYCGRRNSLFHKCQEVLVSCVIMHKNASSFCPSPLGQELTKCPEYIRIPPLPYAIFLSFLCYHELGDRRRRDTALTQLRVVKYDEHQGSSKFWIVNNLIGSCYELIGDTRRAIREYQESLCGSKVFQQYNPAREKIARLQQSQEESL